MSRRTLRIILLAMVAFVGGLFAARALHESRSPPAPPRLQRATWLPGGGSQICFELPLAPVNSEK